MLHAQDQLGETIAEALADAGWGIGLHHGDDAERAERLALRIESSGGHALALPADLEDHGRVAYMVDSLAAHFGPVLVVVGRHDDRLESVRSPVVAAVVDGMAGQGYGRLVALRFPGESAPVWRAPEPLPPGVELQTLELEARGPRWRSRLAGALSEALSG